MSNDSGKRKLPTRAGWWFVETDEGAIEAVEICEFGGVLKYVTALGSGHVDRDDLEWLAPIPGPAVLAALAEYSGGFMARDDDARAGGAYANGEVRRERIAADALHDAIRAERDGAA